MKSGYVCGYWQCNRRIPSNHFLCAEHYEDWQDYLIDECPGCGRFKDAMYKLCLDCVNRRAFAQWKPAVAISSQKQRYAPEHSKVWAKGDKEAERFFVYILKLDDGSFYVGQTNALRERMSEHRDNKVPSTAGRNPKPQYFEILPTRWSATSRESKLKKLKDSNPRLIRRMIIGFHDLIGELTIE